jgi:hypothetical protein
MSNTAASTGMNLESAPLNELLAELGRRGHGAALHGSIGALHDHLDKTGALVTDKLTAYLMYRIRRDASTFAAALSPHERKHMATTWQQKIDAL